MFALPVDRSPCEEDIDLTKRQRVTQSDRAQTVKLHLNLLAGFQRSDNPSHAQHGARHNAGVIARIRECQR
jgi:hypothetical protein